MTFDSCMAHWVMNLSLLLNFSQTGNMLALIFANIVALRQEVTINLHQITIKEDTIHFQLQQIVPNIHIIVGSIQEIDREMPRFSSSCIQLIINGKYPAQCANTIMPCANAIMPCTIPPQTCTKFRRHQPNISYFNLYLKLAIPSEMPAHCDQPRSSLKTVKLTAALIQTEYAMISIEIDTDTHIYSQIYIQTNKHSFQTATT